MQIEVDHKIRKRLLKMKMMAYAVLLGELALVGCATGGRSAVTLEDELILAFGSYSNACEATMQIHPALGQKGFPVELSRECRIYTLEVLRHFIRYVGDAEISAHEANPSEPCRCRCGLEPTMELRMLTNENKFSIYFTEGGFLCDYLCPNPDSLPFVKFTLQNCVEECRKAFDVIKNKEVIEIPSRCVPTSSSWIYPIRLFGFMVDQQLLQTGDEVDEREENK